jgi:PHD/YefM family antitoxin component YafN of YafNO toxin-antitoxin module
MSNQQLARRDVISNTLQTIRNQVNSLMLKDKQKADRDRELAQAAALRKRADDLEKAQTAEVDNTVIVDIKQTFENVSITKTGDKSTVVIPTEDYDKMIARLDWLDCLEAAGVDSWDGYDTARQMFAEQQAA